MRSEYLNASCYSWYSADCESMLIGRQLLALLCHAIDHHHITQCRSLQQHSSHGKDARL